MSCWPPDRAFSAASARANVVDGLSALFARDVVMPVPPGQFAEGRDNAIAALRANPDNLTGRLEWTPIRGGVSGDGQHGFTFGYMTLTQADGATVPLKYMAYWVKGEDGWRAVAFKRSRRAAGDVSLALMEPALPAALTRATTDAATLDRIRASLDRAERDFSDTAQRIGLGAAFTQFGRADAVNMGGPNDAAFVLGAEAIGRTVGAGAPGNQSPVFWAPDRVIAASSGDLGVTIGYIRRVGTPTNGESTAGIPFFTIWWRATPDSPWRYIAE